ncbi:MAG: phosphate transport system protein [Myxococcota bacterium]|jgi:phosphate transport system protein
MPPRTDREYAAKLALLRKRLLLMAGRVETMIGASMHALVERDATVARETISMDATVNRAEREIDELCLLILAKWHPVASDLRFITLVLKMVTDLERIGDLAVNICERAVDLAQLPQLRPYEDIPKMAAIVESMLHDAMEAFLARDVDKARAIMKRDDTLDRLYTQVFRDVLEVMAENPVAVTRGIHVQSVAKWLERMGDHATNLAEQIIFLIDGKDIRHEGKLG